MFSRMRKQSFSWIFLNRGKNSLLFVGRLARALLTNLSSSVLSTRSFQSCRLFCILSTMSDTQHVSRILTFGILSRHVLPTVLLIDFISPTCACSFSWSISSIYSFSVSFHCLSIQPSPRQFVGPLSHPLFYGG